MFLLVLLKVIITILWMETVQNFYTSLIVGSELTMVSPTFQATVNDKQMFLQEFLKEHDFHDAVVRVTDVNNNDGTLVSLSGVVTKSQSQKR